MFYEQANPEKAKRLSQVLPKSISFNTGDVGVYALENGAAKNIMDKETGLIDASPIDRVSNDIAIQFEKLLEEGNEQS